MDSEGAVLSTGNFDSITREDLAKAVEKFQGKISQTPPMYAAFSAYTFQIVEASLTSASLL